MNLKMVKITEIIATIIFIGYTSCENQISSYRDSYVLLNGAFYKYHDDLQTWDVAKETCENEGATLFYPENGEEKISLKDNWLMSKLSNSTRYLHVGVYDANGTGFMMNVDNQQFIQPSNNVYTEIGHRMCMMLQYPEMIIQGHHCQFKTTFICKVKQAELRWNADCSMTVPTRDKYDYEFSSTLKKCYKLHTTQKTWPAAYASCAAEQSALAELNSPEEADHLIGMLARLLKKDIGLVCLGLKYCDDGWETLSGLPLRKSGYALWAHTQPDGGKNEMYGAMTYNGRLHDIASDATCIFFCEHKPLGKKP